MLISLDEKDLVVEDIPQVLRVLHPGLGIDLDKAMAGQHTAMTDLVLAVTGLVLVTRRSIIVTGLVRMCSSEESLLQALIVMLVMTRTIDHLELRG